MRRIATAGCLAFLCLSGATAKAATETILAIKSVFRSDYTLRIDYDDLGTLSSRVQLWLLRAPSLDANGYDVENSDKRILQYDGTTWELWAEVPQDWSYVAFAYQLPGKSLQLLRWPFVDLHQQRPPKKVLKEIAVPVEPLPVPRLLLVTDVSATQSPRRPAHPL